MQYCSVGELFLELCVLVEDDCVYVLCLLSSQIVAHHDVMEDCTLDVDAMIS